MIVCTSVCSNYIPKAKALAESLKNNEKDAKFVLCLTERELPAHSASGKLFDEIVLSRDLGFKNFENYIFKHGIVEASTSVKGQLFRYLLEKYPKEDIFIYLDPDILVLSPLVELKKQLINNEIVLIPHLTIPEQKSTYLETRDAVMDNELCALKHGVYNLGFLAIRRGDESSRFIDWWCSRLEMFCYDNIPEGIFTDQRWIDLAPCFFDVSILRHPGYDVAPWNVSMRKITSKDNKYFANDMPIRFFHFSGFDSGANEGMIKKYVPDLSNSVYKLRNSYIDKLTEFGQDDFGNYAWAYDYFVSGEKIEQDVRKIFRDNLNLQNYVKDPFLESNLSIRKLAQRI